MPINKSVAFKLGSRIIGEDWFGTGIDGNVTIRTNTFLPVEEDTGFVFKQYNNLTINRSVTLTPDHRCNGMVLLVKQNLVVNGTISMNKMASFVNDNQESVLNEPHIALLRNGYHLLTGDYLIGGNGGNGGAQTYYGGGRVGGSGGSGHEAGGGLGGGGAPNTLDSGRGRSNGANGDRPIHGQPFPVAPSYSQPDPVYGAGGYLEYESSISYGGAGPGGTGAYMTAYEYSSTVTYYYGNNGISGDAYGGGAIYIFVGGDLIIGSSGIISANGGPGGGDKNRYWLSTGGGGGGGIVCICHRGTITNNGSVQANGGPAGVNNSNYWHGTDGSVGTVFIENYYDLPKE